MPAPDAEELALETGTLRLTARAHGPEDGIPVLALHGWLDNAASFDRLAPRLNGLRLVALDLPGHGRSEHRPAGSAYHFLDYLGDVLAAADALGWGRFSLLGHSLGGAIATVLAGSVPARVERLALIDSLGPLSEDPAESPARLARALGSQARPRRPARTYRDLEAAVAARSAASELSLVAARLLVERATARDEHGLRWRSDPRLRQPSPYRLTESQVLAFLGAIEAPALLIAADEGHLPPDDPVLTRRLAAIGRYRLERLPGGHHLHLEDPASGATLLGPFLRLEDAQR